MRFSQLTAVTRTATDEFAVDIDPSSFIVRGPNGGYLAALLLRALTERVDDPSRSVRSLTVHFPAAPVVGPATITTEIVRQGRSLVTVMARLHQGGKPMAVALAAYSPAWPTTITLSEPAPAAPPPSETPLIERVTELPFLQHWEQRQCLGSPPQAAAHIADTGGWLRLAEPEPIDSFVVAAMTDAWFPALFTMLPEPNPVPTIDLTVHFRAALPSPSAPPDQPVLVRFVTRTIADGFLEEDGHIWAPDGTLLAQSRQLAIVLPG
jgi:acyl-CoA thioesterase